MAYLKFSFYYIATYLLSGGIGFLFFPNQFSKILLTNTFYEETPVRLAGMFSLLFGILVLQVARHKLYIMYETSVWIRIIAIGVLLWLYSMSFNPMFLSITAIVGAGLLISIFGHYKSRGIKAVKDPMV